jgi:hypothetical protein
MSLLCRRAALAALLIAAVPLARAQLSLPFKLPQLPTTASLTNSVDELKQKAMEDAVQKILDNELPLKLDDSKMFPTVAALPGGPFKPSVLTLTSADMDTPLPPGDYTVNALAFCTEYSVHRPGAGTAYVIGPLQGKAADAISSLLMRGTLQQYPAQQLQGVSWAIQSGLTYDQMPKTYQAVIDKLIPEFKGELAGNFLQEIQNTYQDAAKVTKLPPLEQVLGKMGQSGQLALSAMKQQQILLAQDTNDQLREQTLFRGQESGVLSPVKAQDGPWTERIPGLAYMRFRVVGGNGANNNVLEIRILPQNGLSTAATLPGRLLRVLYPMQVAAAAAAPPPTMSSLLAKIITAALGNPTQNLEPEIVPASLPCGMSADAWKNYVATSLAYKKFGDCACPPNKWNLCSNGSGTLAPADSTSTVGHLTVYAGFCEGATQNGIEFVPHDLPASCTSSNQHIWQFVNTAPPSGSKDTFYKSASCKNPKDASQPLQRNYNTWYLDACPADAATDNVNSHLNPELPTASGTMAAMDQPVPYDNSDKPLTKQFYDLLICGSAIVSAVTWSEQGLGNTQSCATADGNHRHILGQYGNISAIPDPATNGKLVTAVCAGIQQQKTYSNGYSTTQTLSSMATQLNCH